MINILLYIDPGTLMILIQLIVSIFAGIAIFFKKLRKRIINFLKNITNKKY
jgi:hypothetical protein